MAYTKEIWVPGVPPSLTAGELNRMEQGIADAHAFANPAVVAALPGSPTDGQVALWRTTVAGLGAVTRRMRYDAGLAKWEQLGVGGKVRNRVTERQARTITTSSTVAEVSTALRLAIPAAPGDLIEARLLTIADNPSNIWNAGFCTINDASAVVNGFPGVPGDSFNPFFRPAGDGVRYVFGTALWRVLAGDVRADGSVVVSPVLHTGGASATWGNASIGTSIEVVNFGQADA